MSNFVFFFFYGDRAKKSKTFKFLLLLLFTLPVLCHAQIQVYNSGQAFTCIATDVNGEIWAGTNANGLWKCRRINIPVPNTLEKEFIKYSADEQFNKFNLQSIATDKKGYVWVGHKGRGGTTAAGGGVDQFSMLSRTNSKHYTPYSRITKLQNGGIPSLDSKAIAVDKNGTVWTANGYHDLFVPSAVDPYVDAWGNIYPGTPAQYILTCGGIAYKRAEMNVFDTVNTLEAGIPYGAYTINTPFDKSSGTRQCISIAAGPTEVWAGVGLYESADAGFIGNRILRFNLDGSFKDYFNNIKNPSLPNTRAISIYFQSNGTGWVGFQSRGFGVYKNGTWSYISTLNDKGAVSKLFPTGIAYAGNSPGLISGRGNKVFIGTTSGLLMYKGKGDYAQDSSYVLFTTSEGLPSNNIKGVATDEESVWIATDKGIARMPISADLFIYHLDGYPIDPLTTTKRTLLNSVDQNGTDDIATYIAADSSEATVFLYKTLNADKLKFAIEENANDKVDINKQEFGYFTVISRGADSVKVQYHHPRFIQSSYLRNNLNGREVTLQVMDITTNTVVFKAKIKFVLPPVLMVHGVWSSIEALKPLSEYLRDNKDGYQFFDFQLSRIFRTDIKLKENSFEADAGEVPAGIEKLITECAKNNLSAGKVSVVGHSRGGLYARYYLQGTKTPYRNDMYELITINSPHSGSQSANLLLDKRIIAKDKTVGELLKPLMLDPDDDVNGANELKVNSTLVIDVINGNRYLNRNKVPSHAITSEYIFGVFSKSDLLKHLYVNALLPVPVVGDFIAGLRLAILSMGTACVEGPIDNCLKEIYREANDIVVPLRSQTGGLESKAVSYIGDKVAHAPKKFAPLLIDIVGTTYMQETHKKVLTLLLQNPYDPNSSFSENGFRPPNLNGTYNFLPGLNGNPEVGRTANAELTIDDSVKGKSFKFGDNVPIKVTGSSEVKTLMVAYTGDALTETLSDVDLNNSFTFNFPVPNDASGKILVTAYGFNEGGLIAIDSSYINISLPPNAELLRVMIDGDKERAIRQTEIHPYTVKGLYSDSVMRNITFSDSVRYVIRDTSVMNLSGIGNIQGKQQGYTYLIAVVGKKVDSIQVNVIDNPLLRQTLLDNFTGTADNSKNIQLNWTTYQEFRNAFFVIERSNGSSFDSIGVSKGSGTLYTTSSYKFTDAKATGDTIYYRLRMVDSTNHSVYSRIITVIRNTAESLPVALLSFTVNYIQNKVWLDWSTVTEQNNKQFDIEASRDGTLFLTIGTVPGKGNSSTLVSYSFNDKTFFKPGKNYYRLKQVDFDGNYKFSAVVVVNVDATQQSIISIHPNPASNMITLSASRPLGGSLQMTLADVSGRHIWSKSLNGSRSAIPVYLPKLGKGMYLITILTDKGEILLTDKLIIQ